MRSDSTFQAVDKRHPRHEQLANTSLILSPCRRPTKLSSRLQQGAAVAASFKVALQDNRKQCSLILSNVTSSWVPQGETGMSENGFGTVQSSRFEPFLRDDSLKKLH